MSHQQHSERAESTERHKHDSKGRQQHDSKAQQYEETTGNPYHLSKNVRLAATGLIVFMIVSVTLLFMTGIFRF